MKETCVLDIWVVPELPRQLILGIDFWKSMNIVPDLRQNIWHFCKDIPKSVQIESILCESSLSPWQRQELNALVEEKKALMGTSLGRTHLVSHSIELVPETKPIKQRYYQVSPAKQKIIDEEMKKMLQNDIIEPCRSPWSSPVCMIRKRDGSYRFCVDYIGS
nr:uncharacterized protein LOC111515563 [Leptinotarsa decemlineata]